MSTMGADPATTQRGRSVPTKTRGSSPLWARALEQYRRELDRADDYEVVNEIHSLDDLLAHVNTLRPALHERRFLASVKNLEPKLKFVHDFAAILALFLGANPTHTALLWGSIRLMLNYAQNAGDMLEKVLTMIEDLSIKLPRFKLYEDTLPLNRDFESALVDVYAEFICFYARAIQFFRTNRTQMLRDIAWDNFNADFVRTMQRLNRLAQSVETQADMAQMHLQEGTFKEALGALKLVNSGEGRFFLKKKFHQLPPLGNHVADMRGPELDLITTCLADVGPRTLKSIVLVGMGGVGKTRLALQYAHIAADEYDVIMWIAAENSITLSQGFRDVVTGLELAKASELKDDAAAAVLRVKTWMLNTASSWLLIFDNVDDLAVVRSALPSTSAGRIIITTRDKNIAAGLGAEVLAVEPLSIDGGAKFLLSLLDSDSQDVRALQNASAISERMGGLPLALRQAGSFINIHKKSLAEFLTLYERHSARIHAKGVIGGDYEHTLSTVWKVSLEKLSEESVELLNVLAFMDPDGTDSKILTDGCQKIDPEFQISSLSDEMDFEDAQEQLLQISLINKGVNHQKLCVHRLVQAAVIERLSEAERAKIFGFVVQLLSCGFPRQWNVDVSHQIAAWENCEMCLPSINSLAAVKRRYRIKPPDIQLYGELLLQSAWYLYEREMYDVAETFVKEASEAFPDKNSLQYAGAVNLSGLIALDLKRSLEALECFQKAFDIRRGHVAREDRVISGGMNNIALTYTELGQLEDAYRLHQEAIDLRLETKSDRIGNSYSNMSSLLLRMGKPDEAEEMLKRCPALQDFSDETFLNSGNSRFSGDMVLLSRIRYQQGRHEEALRLASKALAFRQQILGNRLKTCDSLYDVATYLHVQGKTAAAISLLDELVSIASTLREGEGQLARALYKLAIFSAERDVSKDSAAYKAQSLELQRKLRNDGKEPVFEEAAFNDLCLWMLW